MQWNLSKESYMEYALWFMACKEYIGRYVTDPEHAMIPYLHEYHVGVSVPCVALKMQA